MWQALVTIYFLLFIYSTLLFIRSLWSWNCWSAASVLLLSRACQTKVWFNLMVSTEVDLLMSEAWKKVGNYNINCWVGGVKTHLEKTYFWKINKRTHGVLQDFDCNVRFVLKERLLCPITSFILSFTRKNKIKSSLSF